MIGNKIIRFEELDSTNKYVKTHKDELESGTVVIAKYQTNGYGRLQRSWHEKKNDNLSCTVYLKLSVKDNISVLTQLAAASVYNLLSIYNINSKIKWPNDILVNNKKISGILVETIIENDIVHVAIGIGLNVNNCMFDGEIASTATSVILESGNLQQVEEVFEKLVKELNDIYQAYIKEDLSFMAICRMHSCLIGKAIKLENEIVLVKDIDDLGRLIIDKNGIDTAYFGSEISLHDIYESVGE